MGWLDDLGRCKLGGHLKALAVTLRIRPLRAYTKAVLAGTVKVSLNEIFSREKIRKQTSNLGADWLLKVE